MIVIDASVGGKWLLKIDESFRKEALELLRKHVNEEEAIVVPELFFYEIANAIATKTAVSEKNISALLNKLFSVNLSIYHPTEDDVTLSTQLAKKYKTSVYDMLYAIVAKRQKCRLITADKSFIEKTQFTFVKLLKDIVMDYKG